MSGASDIPVLDVLLHLGTLVAVFVAYWAGCGIWCWSFPWGKDWPWNHPPDPPARRMILLIIVGTLPLFVVLPIKFCGRSGG